jgi:putative membrane protein
MRNAFWALVLLAGCSTAESDAAPRDDSAGRRDSIAAVATASMREEHVIGLLALANAADSAIGSMGYARGGTRELKDFGIMISREHMALRRDVLRMAADLKLGAAEPPVAPAAAPAHLRAMLDSAAAGSAWDRAYLDLAIAAHEASLENLARAYAATRSPEIRKYIDRSAPIIQKHLEKAKRLQKAAASAPMRNAS